MHKFHTTGLYENPEFQSAMVRLGLWFFAVIYVYAGALSDRYDVDMDLVFVLFALYLLFFLGLLVSVLLRPVWEERRHFSLMVDISGATVCIYVTGEASSPFFILYIWIFVSYGSRYGKWHLSAASIISVIAYSMVVTILDQWGEYFFEVSFVLLALGVLPVYQHSLMNQLHVARSEAERSNRMVGGFLSNMTSEMRGPLVDILATTKALSNSKLSMGQLDKVDDINTSASLLDSVISDVLDFYKLEAGQLQIQSVPFNLRALIAEVCSASAKRALFRQIEIICSVASGIPSIILSDEQRLKQVLSNILKSAIGRCSGDELLLKVQIYNADHAMLLFEIKGAMSILSDGESEAEDDSVAIHGLPDGLSEFGPDLGVNFASRLISLLGGNFGCGSREEGVIFWFSFPAKTDDFAVDQVCELSGLQGKKAFVFEPNKASRDEIIRCCVEHGMMVEAVDKVGELSAAASGTRQDQNADIVLIADSPGGRDVARIADVCLDVLGRDLPLVVLAYRHNCLDLTKYSSVRLLMKPFIHDQLVDVMEQALNGSRS